MTEKDLNFIVATLKGERVLDEPNWYSVLGFLDCHRVSGLFYNRALMCELFIPKKIEKLLKETFEKQKNKVAFMRDELRVITEGLKQEKVPYMLLKGSVLANLSDELKIYEDGERVSNDIDLLVKPDGITAVSNILHELGFVQGVYIPEDNTIKEFSRMEIVKRRMNRGEVAPFVKKTDDDTFPFVEVDINFSLGNTPTEKIELLREMINSSNNYSGKISMSVPSEELFFLHLIMHQYKESCLMFMVERSKDLDLYKLADIYYIWKSRTLDLSNLVELVNKFNLQQEIGYVLNQVGEVFSDKELVDFSRQFAYSVPKIIDYENKKTYEWQATVKERICAFNAKKYLREIEL